MAKKACVIVSCCGNCPYFDIVYKDNNEPLDECISLYCRLQQKDITNNKDIDYYFEHIADSCPLPEAK